MRNFELRYFIFHRINELSKLFKHFNHLYKVYRNLQILGDGSERLEILLIIHTHQLVKSKYLLSIIFSCIQLSLFLSLQFIH